MEAYHKRRFGGRVEKVDLRMVFSNTLMPIPMKDSILSISKKKIVYQQKEGVRR